MEVTRLFPVTVVQDEIKIDDIVPGVIELIASGRLDGTKESRRSTIGNGWRSKLDIHRSPWTQTLVNIVERIQNFTDRALSVTYQSPRYRIGECWLTKLGKGGYNAAHDHHPYDWSGVLWLDVEGYDTNEPDGMFEFMSPYYSKAFNQPTGSLIIQPLNGVAILFPSALKHMVHPVTTERTRISLAWNLHMEHGT